MKQGNEYAYAIRRYAGIPKAVLGALAVSFAARLWEIDMAELEAPDKISRVLVKEWLILYENRIVPQPPPTRLMRELGLS